MASAPPLVTGTLLMPMTMATAPPKIPIGEERRVQASQLRIVTVVMTAFNIMCAASMIFRILRDARRTYLKQRRKDDTGEVGGRYGDKKGSGKRRRGREDLIPVVEIFPLVLGGTILVQGILLAVVEGAGLDGRPITKNCGFLSEVAWIAQWITPYMVFSFTLEACIRAILRPRFKRRSGTAVAGCIFLVLFMLLLTWVPSRTMPARREDDICSGQLMLYIDQFAAGGLGIMAALLPLSVIMGAVVFMHLRKDCGKYTGSVERMSSSWTMYFLAISVPQWIMLVPNYVVTASSGPKNSLVYLSTFIINLSGAAATVLHLYLRSKHSPYYPNLMALSSRPLLLYEKSPPPYQKPTPPLPSPPPPVSPRGINRLSTHTIRSFQRLGDEITTILSNMRSSPSPTPASQKRSPSYSPFPPISTRCRSILGKSTSSSPKPPPCRPPRTEAPTVNFSRTQGLKVPEKAVVARGCKLLKPAAAVEVAVPPRGVEAGEDSDAESFMEIVVWRGGEGRYV